MKTTLFLLADLSYQHGLIGLNEYSERIKTIEWLTSDDQKVTEEFRPKPYEDNSNIAVDSKLNDSTDSLSLLALKKWIFTIGDTDWFPSVPHGHLNSKNNKVKLNPYTGFIYDKNRKEESRLDKVEMITLWNDTKFRDHCREQINWYASFAPDYGFPRARGGKEGKLILPRWRRR